IYFDAYCYIKSITDKNFFSSFFYCIMKIEEVFLMKHFSTESLFDVLGELFSDEISIGITDEEKYLYFRQSKRIDWKIKLEDIIKERTLDNKELTTGKK